jgi:hypothetical protein
MKYPLSCYKKYDAYFGDLHNHCGISYGHGSLEDALRNAREQLDFCSVTGHAHWPDMPEPNERIQYIIDFHKVGFAKLKAGWKSMLETLRKHNKDGQFLVFPGFEIHSNADGDRTIMYKDLGGEIIYADGIADLHRRLDILNGEGVESMAFPHHIGYRTGTRGINWETFQSGKEPIVEIISMHGCSEESENTRPFLHSMGGCDWKSTAQYGLQQGHVFGFTGNTDHHSGHPGSYGHGATGVWAEGLDRQSIWKALQERRTYAITGDRIQLQFSVNGHPMGAVIANESHRKLEIMVHAAGAIDSVDVIKNNQLHERIWRNPSSPTGDGDSIHTQIYLELGWGERNKPIKWDAKLGISDGQIKRIEPRFRGKEVVSPVEEEDVSKKGSYESNWSREDDKSVRFETVTRSNPNNSTNGSQGMFLEVEMPADGNVEIELNGRKECVPLKRLIEGALSGHLGGIDSPAWRLHRAPLSEEFIWHTELEDEGAEGDFYYVRVRQKNDQWAWSSPVFLK